MQLEQYKIYYSYSHLSKNEKKLIELIKNANNVLLKSPNERQYSLHKITRKVIIKEIIANREEEIRGGSFINKLAIEENSWKFPGIYVDQKI